MNRKIYRRNHSGFTLVELLVSITIIAILMGLILGLSGLARRKSAETKAQADLQVIATALEEYRLATGSYPSDIRTLTNSPAIRLELKEKIPDSDPWGNAFIYTKDGKYSYQLRSQGAQTSSTDDDILVGNQ